MNTRFRFLFFAALLIGVYTPKTIFAQAETQNPATLPTGTGLNWKTQGNANTVDGTHFIGTTDNVPLNLRINNLRAGRIDQLSHNVSYGYMTGLIGNHQVAIGDSALRFGGGSYNTAVGSRAMAFAGSSQNTSIGYMAGYRVAWANNVFIGHQSGMATGNGQGNVFVGAFTGITNSTGSDNVYIGGSAGRFNIDGQRNTLVGTGAGSDNLTSQNTLVGYMSGTNTTTGSSNVALGNHTLYNNTTRGYLVAIGDSALYNNGQGASGIFEATQNVAIGSKVLRANTTGQGNTAVGYLAQEYNTTGQYNTAQGNQSLRLNTTGSNNSATGVFTLYSNTTGKYNTALGESTLFLNTTGNSNVAVGVHALLKNTIRSNLVAIGDSALLNNGVGATTGQAEWNTALGSKALYTNTTGYSNTATGHNALLLNTTGFNNTAMGAFAHYFNTTGSANTALGQSAMYLNTTGGSNTAVGFGTLDGNNTGSQNTAVGNRALNTNTSGEYNTGLGYFANTGSSALTNASAIGALAYVTASNCMVLGSISGTNTATANTNVGIGTTAPVVRFQVDNGTDVQLTVPASGYVIIGNAANTNIAIDNNEIMARNGTSTSTLAIQAEGGATQWHQVTGTSTDDVAITDAGDIGIGTFTPATRLQILNGSDASLTTDGYLINGATTGLNMVIDNNEIICRNNGAVDDLYLQTNGGNVVVGFIAAPAYNLQLQNNSAAKPGTNTWTIASDARLKKDIHDYKEGIKEVMQINPVWFTYTGQAGLPPTTHVGVIAQELQQIAPHMVGTFTAKQPDGTPTQYLSVDNGAMVYMLINAVKQLQQTITQQQAEINTIKSQLPTHQTTN